MRSRCISTYVLAFLACVTFVLPPGAWLGTARAAPALPEKVRKGLEEIARRYELLDEDVRQDLKRLPRDSFALGAAVARTGEDPDALFALVRDRTRWVPYRGLLRGARGTLMDRSGSTLDRAVLLAALLEKAGHEARLARGRLTLEAARDLFARLPRPAAPEPPSFTPKADATALRAQAERYGMDANELIQFDRTRLVSDQADWERKVQDSVLQWTRVMERLEGAPRPGRNVDAVELLRDHWWVQVRSGNGWIDLDPTTPDARPGEARTTPTATMAAKDVPADLRHEVSVRVVVERRAGARLHEEIPLETTLPIRELAGTHVSLGHLPLDWPSGLPLFHGDPRSNEKGLHRAAASQKEWLPILFLGEKAVERASVRADGTLVAKPVKDKKARKVGGAAGDLFGRRLGGEAAGKPSGSEWTAEWLEFEIRAPGEAPRTVRRPVFDLLGPAARANPATAPAGLAPRQRDSRALQLLGHTDILVLAGELSAERIAQLRLMAFLRISKAVVAMTRAGAAMDSKAFDAAVRDLRRFPARLYDLAWERAVLGPHADVAYVDRPVILSEFCYPDLTDDGRGLVRVGFDIVANRGGVDPRIRIDPFEVRVARGIVDSVLESRLVHRPRYDGGPVYVEVASTSSLFGRAETGRWTCVRTPEDDGLAKLPADLRTRIVAELEGGRWALVPEKPGQLNASATWGWWSVDPTTGRTLGMMGSGRGEAVLEYWELVNLVQGIAVGAVNAQICMGKDPSTTKIIVCGICGGLTMAGTILSLPTPAGAGIELSGAASGGLLWGGHACMFSGFVK